MSSVPRFSIVIPLFNRELLIRDTLDSLLRQTLPDWEAIVVDDGSTDHSCETVREYSQSDPRIKLLHRTADRIKGPSACRNIGFENAQGQYVYYLDSDDLLERRFCENASKTFEKNPSIDFLGVQCIYFSGEVQKLFQTDFPLLFHDDDIRTHYLEKTLWLQTESFCWKKSFLDSFPRHWPEDQRVGEDRVCYYRILTRPCHGLWEQDAVQVYHRTGKTGAGQHNQLTSQINRNSALASERVLTAQRLIDAFRDSEALTSSSQTLLLDNTLYALRDLLSCNHIQAAKDCFRLLRTFAHESNRPEFIRKGTWYMRLRCLFRLYRIPLIEKSFMNVRRFLKGKRG